MKVEKAIDGLIKYIDKNILPGMNDLQEVGYLTFAEVVRSDTKAIEQLLSNNIFARMLFSTDSNGDVNLERLVSGLKKVISKKGSLTFTIPMYGNFKITNDDISEILKNMTENSYENNP